MPSAAPPSIGPLLRNARLERSLSIEETAWRTRMRPELLRALEGEAFDELGHVAHVRSHLHSYARFLGIDPTEVVDAFTRAHAADTPSSIEELERQRRASRKPPRPKWLIAALISAVVLIAAAAIGVIGGQAERPAPEQSPVADAPEIVSSASSLPVPPEEALVRLRVEALEGVTVSILADSQPLFEGEMVAGQVKWFNARSELEVLIADGGAVTLRLNDRSLGTPGTSGRVYRQRFRAEGSLGG